jgi:ABC-2 type transport system permease protein
VTNLLVIAGKDLRLRIRDRSVVIVAVLAPLVLAFIFNAVFGSIFGGDPSFRPAVGIVAGDSPRSEGALRAAAESAGATWESFADRRQAEEAVSSGRVDAVMVLEGGFDQGLDQGRGGEIEVIGNVDAPTASGFALAIATGYGRAVDQISLRVATSIALGGDLTRVVPAATATPFPVAVDDVTAEVRQLDGTTSTVAGMSVFFLLFTAQVGLLSLLEERRDGTLARILSTPTRPAGVLAAKALVSVVLGITSMTVLIFAGKLIMGAEWGNPAGVALLVVAAVLAAVGISALTVGLARTPEGAGNIQGIVGTVLGLLGGVFFPIGEDGGVLARLSALTPHHWFLRGLGELAGGSPVTAALASVGWLLVMAAVTGLAALALVRRQVVR